DMPRPGMPHPPIPTPVTYHYAKLAENDQVFEVRDTSLRPLAVDVNSLRDPRLARFDSNDARRLEIRVGKQEIVLKKEKEDWVLVKPARHETDFGKVTELLDKLANLEVKDREIIDPDPQKAATAPKTFGLDRPAGTVTVTVEEKAGEKDKGAKKKPGKQKEITFVLGKQDREAGK